MGFCPTIGNYFPNCCLIADLSTEYARTSLKDFVTTNLTSASYIFFNIVAYLSNQKKKIHPHIVPKNLVRATKKELTLLDELKLPSSLRSSLITFITKIIIVQKQLFCKSKKTKKKNF